LATFPLPRLLRYRLNLRLVAPGRAAGARHPGQSLARRGLEHLPNRPAVILAKHQSAWETDGLPAAFSAAGAGAQARAAVDPVSRLGLAR